MEDCVAMVYQVQNEVIEKVLADLPETKDVTYFQTVVQFNIKIRKIYSI